TNTIKPQPEIAIFDALKNLLNYLNTKLEDKFYHSLREVTKISIFVELITIWQLAYNCYGPTICAKDQTKVAKIIEKLHTKISSFEKATYITVFALTAILLGIPLLVLAFIPSNQKETKANIFFKNNIVLKELIKSNAKLIELYFNKTAYDQS
ncbi:28229_t:CDS:2, partial [Gigaspora margarita]